MYSAGDRGVLVNVLRLRQRSNTTYTPSETVEKMHMYPAIDSGVVQ
jgi:hypothetical protein